MQHCKNNDYVCQKVMLLNVKISKSQYEILSIEKIYAKKMYMYIFFSCRPRLFDQTIQGKFQCYTVQFHLQYNLLGL